MSQRSLCRIAGFGVVVVAGAGCGNSPAADGPAVRMNVAHSVVQEEISDDPAMDSLIAPYRTHLVEQTSEVIGTAGGPFEKADPEGTLDNMVADAMLWAASAASDEPIAFAMGNDGGLRAPINAGPITLAEIFELMPFENRITVVELSGHQVDSLAQQIARSDGEPVAGISMGLAGAPPVAVTVRIGGAPVELDRRYRVAVPDYLANGGGYWPQLWTPLDRVDLNLLIRDAIEAYIRDRGTIEPRLDERIRIEGGNR